MKTIERNYKLDLKDGRQVAIECIRMMRDSLIICRGSTRKPEELEWEIRVYDFIEQDPEVRLKQYQEARCNGGRLIPNRSKRETVALLGWVIP